jgi:hypothetical protein
MMKKVLFTVLIVFTAINVFGADFSLSAGGGGLVGYTFTRYTLQGGENLKSEQSMDRFNYAGFLFFDAHYVEFSVLIQGGNGAYSEKMSFSSSSLSDGSGTGYETSLGFSLMGKYPFSINEKLTWFPLLGLEYHIALIQRRKPEDYPLYDRQNGSLGVDRDKNDKSYPLSAWNSLWINIGAGLDHNIYGPLFLRYELLFGFRLPTVYETGALELVKDQMDVENPSLSGLTGGPSLKIGLGYRF